MEIVRQKNAATYIVFPIVDADGDLVTGASSLDSEIDSWSDGAAPDGFIDCTNEATEIGTTGQYYLSLTQSEMNTDYIIVQVKTATAGAKTQTILIRTMIGDPLNLATTDDGGAVNVASGVVEANVKQLDGSAVDQAAGLINANMKQISADATAADNAEAFFDGTGYAGTNNVIPSVTTVTGNVGGNVTGSVGSIATGGIAAASFAAGAIDAAAIAADAIGASELAAGAVDEILDEQIGDGTITMRQALKLLVATLGGKLSGAATTTVTIRNAADTADIVTATVDANGNRSAVTLAL